MTESISKKVCVITGGARGMGYVTAQALAAQGFHVVLIDWEGEAGSRAVDSLRRQHGPDAASYRFCDLSSLRQVAQLAADLQRDYPRIDRLICNAGITYPEYRLSEDGNEFHFAICHLAHFLLATRLLPQLRASGAGRIVLISSEAHKTCKEIDFDDLNATRFWAGKTVSHNAAFRAYGHAKLCNVLFMRELHERAAGSELTVNAVSPGFFVNTGIHREMRGIFKLGAMLVFQLGSLFNLNTAEKGARTHIFVASDPSLDGVSGRYFESCREKDMSPQVEDSELRRQLWDTSEALVDKALNAA